MAYQETKTTGYGTRLSNSVKGIGTGFVLLIAGTVFLWWNEGRAVKTARMLEEAQGAAVHVENVATIDDSLDGQLIHATAMITTTDSLTDDTFGVGVVAVKLIVRLNIISGWRIPIPRQSTRLVANKRR